MFVQSFKGPVDDPEAVRSALARWAVELAPGATGWLGSTGGVTEDGIFIGIARFDSEQAARRNSDRVEQGEWWASTAMSFTGDVTFTNSTRVDVETPGDPGQAGFVQFMEGRGRNLERARKLMARNSEARAAFRPDVLGSVIADHDDGESFTMVIYFSSEEAARAGEAKEPPAQLRVAMRKLSDLMTVAPTFYDLRDPWLLTPTQPTPPTD